MESSHRYILDKERVIYTKEKIINIGLVSLKPDKLSQVEECLKRLKHHVKEDQQPLIPKFNYIHLKQVTMIRLKCSQRAVSLTL